MNDFAPLIRLFIEKSWAVGVLFVVASGLVMLGETRDVMFPASVREWTPLTFVVGCALIVILIVNAVRAVFARTSDAREKRREASTAAVANLQTLTGQEQQALFELLSQPQRRFEVYLFNDAHRLADKGILTFVQSMGAMTGIYETHPSVLAIKEILLRELSESPTRRSAGF